MKGFQNNSFNYNTPNFATWREGVSWTPLRTGFALSEEESTLRSFVGNRPDVVLLSTLN